MSDMVNNPAHYTQGEMEAKDIIRVILGNKYKYWLLGSCLKYIIRHEYKGEIIQDLRKSEWFLKEYIAEMEKMLDEDR